METKKCIIDKNFIDCETLKEAGEIIKNGGLVAFPTETVYGLGGDAFNPESSKKIYAAKGRPSDNPLIVHIYRIEDIHKVAESVPEKAYALFDEYWPGPLTVILPKKKELPKETTGGLDTVAVRMPSDPIAAEFIKQSGGFVAAPSANRSGRPSPTVAKYVIEDLDGLVDMIIDGGDCEIGLESTIIDLTEETPMILRPGYITPADLERIFGSVSIDKTIISDTDKAKPKAPGMKYRHYAPKGELTIVRGKSEEVIDYINNNSAQIAALNKRIGVICTDETKASYKADSVKSLGRRSDERAIAKNLFRILREFDDEQIDVIFAEGFENNGLSMATMNRLLKAAGHKEVYL